MTWADDKVELLVQIENLIEKYKVILNVNNSDDSEILNWLERKRAKILPRIHSDESSATDEL